VGASLSDEVPNIDSILKIEWVVDSSAMKDSTVVAVDQRSILVMDTFTGVSSIEQYSSRWIE
jgi:hypothetical protein